MRHIDTVCHIYHYGCRDIYGSNVKEAQNVHYY